MTVIANIGKVWIEQLQATQAHVGNDRILQAINLTRPGHVLGVSYCVDPNSGPQGLVHVRLANNVGGGPMILGDYLTQILFDSYKNTAGADSVYVIVVIILSE